MRPKPTPPADWFRGLGVALLVLAARCREIQLHAGLAPYLDQWKVEAQEIIVPWLKGELTWTAFFLPHHEHVPAWTRLAVWVNAAGLGSWDAQWQCTLNAGLWAVTLGIWAGWLRRQMHWVATLLLTALALALTVLPHGWENTTWGFQSHVPIALILVGWYLHGSLFHAPFGGKWLLAQAAGLGALFTLGSMWVAPFAILAVHFWCNERDLRRPVAAAALTVAGGLLMLVASRAQPVAGALSQHATSVPQLLTAFLVQAGWPSSWPGAALLMQLPAALLACRIFRRDDSQPIDRLIVALALWSLLQAAAFAYARGGGWIGFVSRYGDFLLVGTLANALALGRLIQGLARPRWALVALALAWGCASGLGLHWISTRSHTEYFHQHSRLWASLREDAIRQFLASGDSRHLATDEARNLLYPDPAAVAAVLQTPGLTDLLPAGLRPAPTPVPADFFRTMAARLRAGWPYLAATGGLLLLLGLALGRKVPARPAAPLPSNAGPHPLWWTLPATALAGGLIFLWPMPFTFGPNARWPLILAPAGSLPEMQFRITTPTTYVVDNLTGGAALWPEKFRNTFYGTHIDGPGFTGTAMSQQFRLDAPWLVIPYAGYPASPGNRLGLQIEDEAGQVVATLTCPLGNPGPGATDIDFWATDVRPFVGHQARVVLVDGRTDAQGWVAAAPPHPAQSPAEADDRRQAWRMEALATGHLHLAVITAGLGVLAVGTARWRHPRADG